MILSLERMTAIRAVHPSENVLIAEAGATLQSVQQAADGAGRLFPLSLASEGTATIGGNLATNAAERPSCAYGNARDLCLGLEAVLPDGTVWHGLKRLRKDNTGYDLKNLLIGAEGTLCVITAASLRLYPQPAHRVVALLAVPSPQAAQALLALADRRLSGLVSAFELIGRAGFDFLAEVGPRSAPALRRAARTGRFWWNWAFLPRLNPKRPWPRFTPKAAKPGWCWTASSPPQAQAAQLWAIREAIPEANRRIGAVSSHDISLPLSAIPAFIAENRRALADLGPFRVNAFGHLGDGNLHYNVFPPKGATGKSMSAAGDAIKRLVHDRVNALGGSVSAEHGIGRLKVADLERYGDPAKWRRCGREGRAGPLGHPESRAVLRAQPA